MNNLFCPISDEKVDERNIRSTALLTFLIAVFFVLEPNLIAAAFLAIDFYIRGFIRTRSSVLACSAAGLTHLVPFQSKMINKAPKLFAARIGLVFTVLSFISLLSGWPFTSQIIMGILVLFSFLEWAAGFCMGCYVYTIFVVPFFKKD